MAGSWKNQRIQDHFVVLCNELDVDRITPVLRAEHMLTADEFEQLTNPHFTTQTRRQKLLLFIPRKGRAHFEKLGECLVWSGQSELARKIGVPVEDIRPSPHPPVQQSSTSLQAAEFARMMHMLSDGMGHLRYPVNVPPPPYPVHPTATSHPVHHSTTAGHPVPTGVPTATTSSRPVPPATATSHHYTSSPPRHPPLGAPHAAVRPPTTEPASYSHPVQATESGGSSSYHPRPSGGAVYPPPPDGSDPEPSSPKKVLVLYCNDEAMGGGGDFSDSVCALADFLTRVCGQRTRVHCDLYITHPPSNWTRWTEREIRESDAVLLVCSKTLKHMLDHRNPDRPVPMKKGHFDAETVYNLIRSPKFIPVFVNHTGLDDLPDLYSQPYRDWVPSQLLGVTRYWLDLQGLHSDMREPSSEEEYGHELARVLGNPQPARNVEPIFVLLRVLQGVSDTPRPTPFRDPIIPPLDTTYCVLPATHLANKAPPPAELTFTERELLTIASHIPRDWETLGIKLGLLFPALENIRYKHSLDVQGAAMEMLEVWRREKGEQATRTALRESLVAVGYGRIAEKILGKD